MKEEDKDKEDTKEDFCGACLAVPLALIGAGAGAVGSNQKGKHKKTKNIMMWGGIATVVISILIAIYFLWIKKCNDCK